MAVMTERKLKPPALTGEEYGDILCALKEARNARQRKADTATDTATKDNWQRVADTFDELHTLIRTRTEVI